MHEDELSYGWKGGITIPKKKNGGDLFKKELNMLHKRSRAAFDQQDDDLLIKIVNALCKVAESQAKLGVREQEPVEVVFKSPAEQEDENAH